MRFRHEPFDHSRHVQKTAFPASALARSLVLAFPIGQVGKGDLAGF